ncbi:MAG: hypothetical protein K2K55_07470 [Duncaniella sp.]|nr:hypothetical protein [Duncaniella sp.]
MKKILSLLPALFAMFIMSSCSDDDNAGLPEVQISLEYSGAADENGIIIVEQGQDITIDGLYVTPAEGAKNATLGTTTYYLDYQPVVTISLAPYATVIPTSHLSLGRHTLQVRTTIYQVDKEMAWGVFGYEIDVVAPSLDNPEPDGGTLTPNARITTAE